MSVVLRWPNHPKNAHVRTCQECGHTQTSTDPATQKNEAWRTTKCKRCKSESLDYGSTNGEIDENDYDY